MVLLVIDALKISKTLELVQDSHQLSVARMELLLLELLSLVPISAEETIDLELGARVLQMLLDSLEGFDGLGTAEAFNFKALTFVFDMFLEVLKINALLDLVIVAPVQNFNLAQHLI